MTYTSVFDFLKEDDRFFDIYRHCLSMEKQMSYELFDTSFVKGRTICEKLITKIAKNNPKVSYLFSRKKPDGKPFIPGLAEKLGACRDKKIISRPTSNKYYAIKEAGDAGAHGEDSDKYNMDYSKKIHKMVFEITLECYNEFNYPIKVNYFYKLDKNNRKEYTSDDMKEELNQLHMTEIPTEKICEYYKSKKIFLTTDSFKVCVAKYFKNIDSKNEFFNKLNDYTSVNDENIDEILDNVEPKIKTKIKEDARKLSQEKSEKIIEVLNEINGDLRLDELNEMIVSANDNEEREIYSFIKALSNLYLINKLLRIKKELENVLVTFIDENGRKVSKHEKYDIEADENGYSLKISLDPEQKSAVRYAGNKPLVINAGPGSGKTRILVERVVYLIEELNINPSTIFLITFSHKSIKELRNKLINDAGLSIDVVNEIRIDTIYGLCRYVISKFAEAPYNFLNYKEQILFISKFKKELGFDNYAFLYDGLIPRVLNLYSEIFNFDVDINDLINYIEYNMSNIKMTARYEQYVDDFHSKHGQDQFPDLKSLRKYKFMRSYYYHIFLAIANSYPRYKELLEFRKICDFDSLLEKGYAILRRNNFDYYRNVLIDEFQDIDFHQMKIFKMLQEICINNGGSFTIVGDSDQRIYGWRGSSSLFLEDCLKDPNFEVITIHNNYRSSANIVEFNEGLIDDYRIIKKVSNPVNPAGSPVFYLSSSKNEEARNIVQIIKNLKEEKKIRYYSDIALLFRTNKAIENFAEVLDEFKIPYYTLTKHKDFLKQNEVRSMLALFWLLMPYEKNKFVYRSNDFLNLSWLSDEYFRLSKETQEVLKNIQTNFEKQAIKLANEALKSHGKLERLSKYSNIFKKDETIVSYVFDNIETFDLVLLDVADLIKLGITDIGDLEFFSKLRNLKTIMWDTNLTYSEKPDFLYIFNKLLNITDYFKEISIRNDARSIKIKNNLALFSQIINNYEIKRKNKDYLGLFNYLNKFLGDYSCPIRDPNEKFDKVNLMTMHMAKGLEYPVVILCSLKDEIISKRFVNSIFKIPDNLKGNKHLDNELDNFEEEMRLIYVATTRARDLLILSSITNNNQLSSFLQSLQTRNVKIKSLQSYDLTPIQKISSSIIHETDIVKLLNFEEILRDYLFCPYRYDIINNSRFAVRVLNQGDIESVLYEVLFRIHEVDSEDLRSNIISNIHYHNLPNVIKSKLINNIESYWREYGEKYNVFKSNVILRKQMVNCEINGTVDLIIKENENEISLVQFIVSDDKISDYIDEYMKYLYFYTYIMRTYDEFKGYKFKNIILHSIDNNRVHCIPYQSNFEDEVIGRLENIASDIIEEKFDKKIYRCFNCECRGIYC